MEWPLVLVLLFGGFLILVLLGVPVVYAFFGVNIAWLYVLLGSAGLEQLIRSVYGSLALFVLLPITLFIFMGELMFRSDVAQRVLDALDAWLGKLPGRLSILAVVAGALMSALSGASIGSTAMLGGTLVPEMRRRGYSKAMSLGPVLGSGGISIMIPPSGLAVILAVIAGISVGATLIAIIIPGVILGLAYASYIIARAVMRPEEAPRYDVKRIPMSARLWMGLKYIAPLALILFLVVGTIFLGIATPTEAAALGVVGAFVLALVYGGFSWAGSRRAVMTTARTSVMVLVLLAGAEAFSQVLALTGAHRGLADWTVNLPLPPILIIAMMLVMTLILGMFIGGVPLMLITLPIFIPVVETLGFSPLWYGVLTLLAVEMAQTTPPYGILLFVMKGVAPADITIADVTRAALPYIGIDAVVMVILIVAPALVLWLPGMMG
ncbi:TRAP transporter large permease subunit [Egibacter rhizosphaerae]|uniref:TRAP transporter large permease subunit n=1 Tax=Egibacter rhizosphaerae TaxID=1670831 RepID=A0A411YFR7_9ACTN|nr:TRAP transporter large permease subunit [Egibacter rhizosphaerae]QBI20083.1 TRAP transporter large permease subunit [Egibacter rhizosphaerae]